MTFDIAGVKYVVLNDGSVGVTPSMNNADKATRAIPISFEVHHSKFCRLMIGNSVSYECPRHC